MVNSKPISIVVPCYNCSTTIDKCVTSLMNQMMDFKEIILVDDGSTDSTGQICDEYEKQYEVIRSIHQNNGGLVSAWKTGVKAATGDYIGFCDSDDWIEKNYVSQISSCISEDNYDVIAFGMTLDYSNGRSSCAANKIGDGAYEGEALGEVKNHLLFNGKMQSELLLNSRCTKVFRKELLLKIIDYIDEHLSLGEDAVTTCYSVLSSERIRVIGEWFPYHYVRNDSSMVGSYDPTWYEKLIIMKKGLLQASKQMGYDYSYQIENSFFANVLLYTKKEIGRRKESTSKTVEHINYVRKDISDAESLIDISGYKGLSRLYAKLFLKEHIWLLLLFTRAAIMLGIGKN